MSFSDPIPAVPKGWAERQILTIHVIATRASADGSRGDKVEAANILRVRGGALTGSFYETLSRLLAKHCLQRGARSASNSLKAGHLIKAHGGQAVFGLLVKLNVKTTLDRDEFARHRPSGGARHHSDGLVDQ